VPKILLCVEIFEAQAGWGQQSVTLRMSRFLSQNDTKNKNLAIAAETTLKYSTFLVSFESYRWWGINYEEENIFKPMHQEQHQV
jgi:hypothetical protein